MTQKQVHRKPVAAKTHERTAAETATTTTTEPAEHAIAEMDAESTADPSTTTEQGWQADTSDTTTCARCGTELATTDAYMDVDGTICAGCQGEVELGESFRKAYLSVSSTALVLASVSFYFNPFAIVSVMSIIAMVATLLYPRRLDEEDREAVAGYKAPMILAILGGLISLVPLVQWVVGVVALFGG